MIELQKMLEILEWGRQIVGAIEQVPLIPWLGSFWAAVGAMTIGSILALWGGRVLRSMVVLAFMVAGAVVGKQVAGSMQIDLLIGLVIGAGAAGLIGFVFYRWWLGLLMGGLVVLIMSSTYSAPRILNERQAFEDFRMGVGSGRYDTSRSEKYTTEQFREYFWEQNRQFVVKTVLPVLVVGLVVFVATMIAPRLAAVLGTSVLGVLLVAGGTGMLVACKSEDWWNRIQCQQTWVVVGVGVFWLFSVMYQLTHPTRPLGQASMQPPTSPVV